VLVALKAFRPDRFFIWRAQCLAPHPALRADLSPRKSGARFKSASLQISIRRFKQPRLLVLAPPREFELLVFSPPFEGRRSAERRALVVKMRPSDAPSRRLLRPWGRFFRAQARASSPSRQVSPPFTCPVQPLKAEPRSGPGRLPKAPRVCVCETQPRAPHPTGSGYPSPIKLSLCPTSERLMKRPSLDRTRSG
jgi:hypothetical protein